MTAPTPVHAFADDALGEDDATAVAERLAAGEVSPLEVVEASIARIEAVNPRLNAMAYRDFEAALARARKLRRPRGPFGGVPALAKENIHIKGMPMTMGSQAMPTRLRSRDGGFTRQLLDTGLQLLGTTTMPAFGWTATTERMGDDVTRNPWQTEYSSGGSSGGSAALVAAGAVPIAHGNDGGGSIRIPASVCGLVGLKATRGRLRADPTTDTMPIKVVTDGVLARSVRDVARFFEAAELTYRNSDLPAIGSVKDAPARRLRIGVTLDSPQAPVSDAPTRATVQRTAELLARLGHDVFEHETKVPRSFRRDFEDYWSLLAFGMVAGGRRLFGEEFDTDRLDPLTVGLAKRAKRRMAKMPLVIARLAATAGAYEKSFKDVDVILTPVLCHITPHIGHLSADLTFGQHFERLVAYSGFTPWHNAAGGPAISVPAGATDKGLPIGVMFSAPRGDERRLLEIAYEIEESAPFPRIQDLGPPVE
ncbi:MAG: amidase [Actinomycetia bacterium]|nr:amidase [Actinomycetes bacterium]